jgi:hypothetical protein
MSDIPEELLKRMATAKARALGDSHDEIPATAVGSGEPLALPDGVEPLGVEKVRVPDTLHDGIEAARETAIAALGPPPERTAVPRTDVPRATPEPIPAPAAAPAPAAPALEAPAAAPAPEAPAAAAAPEVSAPAEPPAVAQPAPAAAPVVSAGMSVEEAAAALEMPEKLLRRSVEAKAKALGVSVEQALAGMVGGVAPAAAAEAPAPAPAAPAPEAPAAAAAPEAAVPVAQPAPAAAPVVSAGMSVEEAAAALGMPEKLFRRSVEAKAKALGVSVEQALAGMVGGVAPAAAAEAAAPAPAAPAPEAPAAAAAPEAAVPVAQPAPAVPETPVTPPSVQEAAFPAPQESAPAVVDESDVVNAWPALFRIELVTAVLAAVILTLLSLAGPAPLLAQAGEVVDPSKAPWYLVWMEQLFAWLPLGIAGFFVPLLVIVGLFAVPFVDKNPDEGPSSRKLALVLFGIFALAMLVLTLIGLASRSSGFGWPWT